MLLGGALGNILDRLRDGSVTDFIKLPLGWPPFNLADTSITLGVVLLFLVVDHSAPRRAVSAPFHDRLRGRAPAGRRQGAGRRRASRRAAIRRARSPSCSRRAARRAAIPSARGSCTGSTATPRGCSSSSRTEEAHRLLQAALAAREIEREYLALVQGRPPARTGTIEAPIGRDPRVRTRMAVRLGQPRGGARRARTSRSSARSPSTSLLRLRLETGRTHQIRVHLQAIGHPVCGDPRVRDARRCSAWSASSCTPTRLAFDHPLSGERVDVSSPLPADLAAGARARRTGLACARSAILGRRNRSSTRAVRIAALPGARAAQSSPRVRYIRADDQTKSKREYPWLR